LFCRLLSFFTEGDLFYKVFLYNSTIFLLITGNVYQIVKANFKEEYSYSEARSDLKLTAVWGFLVIFSLFVGTNNTNNRILIIYNIITTIGFAGRTIVNYYHLKKKER